MRLLNWRSAFLATSFLALAACGGSGSTDVGTGKKLTAEESQQLENLSMQRFAFTQALVTEGFGCRSEVCQLQVHRNIESGSSDQCASGGEEFVRGCNIHIASLEGQEIVQFCSLSIDSGVGCKRVKLDEAAIAELKIRISDS